MLPQTTNQFVVDAKPAPSVLPKTRGINLAFRGLLWAEWFAHSKLMLFFIGLWLAGVWGLPFFVNPGWILAVGILYVLWAGPAFGGGDVLEGCEEFSFALPATRGERYLARLTLGGGTFFVLTAMNLLVLGLDWTQILARVYVSAGIIRPLPVLKTGLLYGLVLALPFAVFAFSFALSAVTHSRMVILTAWFWGGVAALATLQLGFWYEELVWDSLNGFFSCPLLILAGAAVLWIGYRWYQLKEIAAPATPLTLPGRWWLWIFLFFIGLGLALALLYSLAQSYPKFLV